MKSLDKITGMKNVGHSHEKYYVVLRDNRRVSDANHTSRDSANQEMSYWHEILTRHPDGSAMSIVECENPNFDLE